MMHLTNGIVPRRNLIRRYLALWLSSDVSEHFGLRRFPQRISRFTVAEFGITNDSVVRTEGGKMLQNVLARNKYRSQPQCMLKKISFRMLLSTFFPCLVVSFLDVFSQILGNEASQQNQNPKCPSYHARIIFLQHI
jgi:hypothetical protein